MKSTRLVSLVALASFALAAAAAHASDAAMAKLLDCMKLKAASPEQEACMREVEKLRKATPAAAAPKSAAAPARKAGAAPGAAPAKVQVASAPAEVRQALEANKLQGMDLEAALRAAQSNRSKALQAQVMEQAQSVRKRNEQIAKLNALVAKLNATSYQGTDKDARSVVDKLGADEATLLGVKAPRGQVTLTRAERDQHAAKVKAMIDAQTSSQQMDMLKLQAATSKQNEAYEMMTNFLRKSQETQASIIQKMR